MSSGNKYHRRIYNLTRSDSVQVDVYSVLEAFDVRCPARQHAIKKLLCAGIRGKGDAVQDLTETRDAIDRAIAMEYQRVMRLLEETPVPSVLTPVADMVTALRTGQFTGGVQISPEEPAPEKGELSVVEGDDLIHTMCKTCHNKVAYNIGVKRPDKCRLCVPKAEDGPLAPERLIYE